MRVNISLFEKNATEPARVRVSKSHAVFHNNINMVMFLWFGFFLYKAKAARHAKMDDECASLASQQQIFPPPGYRVYGITCQKFVQRRWNVPTQFLLPDDYITHRVARQNRSDASAGSFNFWQFGQVISCDGCRRYSSWKLLCYCLERVVEDSFIIFLEFEEKW